MEENRIRELLLKLKNPLRVEIKAVFKGTMGEVLAALAMPEGLIDAGEEKLTTLNFSFDSGRNNVWIPASERNPRTASSIANELGKSPTQITRELNNLERIGVISGERGEVPPGGGRPPRKYKLEGEMLINLLKVLIEMQRRRPRRVVP